MIQSLGMRTPMPTVHAVYEGGVFKPSGPVALPDRCEVEFEPRLVASASAKEPVPTFISNPNPTPEEFRRILDAMAALTSVKTLPPDFSRDDIYDDHD
jgi:predicted DNA-binding antitoxin AbrB/MazE fold protein